MRFLVSVPKEKVTDGKWTTRREPVVPCFPSQHGSAFLTVPTFLLASKAEVADIDDDPDEMVAALAKEYPGLPVQLHSNYVMKTFEMAFESEPGEVFRVSVSQNQAMLINDKTGYSLILWDRQPMQ